MHSEERKAPLKLVKPCQVEPPGFSPFSDPFFAATASVYDK